MKVLGRAATLFLDAKSGRGATGERGCRVHVLRQERWLLAAGYRRDNPPAVYREPVSRCSGKGPLHGKPTQWTLTAWQAGASRASCRRRQVSSATGILHQIRKGHTCWADLLVAS